MFNSGSLSGNGANLKKDTTLRILRDVCRKAKVNSFIINLFDYASSSTKTLFDNWGNKDSATLIFDKLNNIPNIPLKAYIRAYGDYENHGIQDTDIKDRADFIKHQIYYFLKEINLPKNKSGTPKHPIVWQRQKIKSDVTSLILKGLK